MADEDKKIVYYLAYGSNLSAETFLGKRGIHPLSSINVVVPSLRLRFDLPGIPYAEPCFANSGPRENHDQALPARLHAASPITPPEKLEDGLASNDDYHKDRWHKGMVGVVYGLTPSDYAHVIATEGAGASYEDVVVPCHPLDPLDSTVPDDPTTPPIQAHTLFAPSNAKPSPGGRVQRPDPSYAQASARYLKLITDGAAEHGLPADYREYLAQLRPYTITTTGQRIGSAIFLGLWMPIVMGMFQLISRVVDADGRAPAWAQKLAEMVFAACWASYDNVFKPVFGDGERTIGQDEDEQRMAAASRERRRCRAPVRPRIVLRESQKTSLVS